LVVSGFFRTFVISRAAVLAIHLDATSKDSRKASIFAIYALRTVVIRLASENPAIADGVVCMSVLPGV